MNNYAVETRRRSRSLLVVEGKHEKDELFWLIFKCFPEMNIDINDVWIYGTNIYKLYEDIVKEYGNDWAKDEMDVDLPFVISKKEHPETIYYRNDFTNIILVFDYERHDPAFSEEKILEMQHCFADSTDMGKLYLNYPMIESYLHLKSIPDEEYINRKILVSLQPGDKYKILVRAESVIEKAVELPHRIDDLLAGDRYRVSDVEKRNGCCDAILKLSANELEKELEETLGKIKGVEDVKVLITYSETEKVVPIYNESSSQSSTQEKDTEGGERKIETYDTNKEVVSDANQTIITEKIMYPKMEGAIVIAKGAQNTIVKENITHAVEAATGLAVHKIQVFEMK